MLPFSALLKDYMDANGYTAYQLSVLSGVNRTSIQRAITTGRIPKREAVEQIADTLKLTHAERKRLFDAYEIATDGEYRFYRRRYVKKLLEDLSRPSKTAEPVIRMGQRTDFSMEIRTGTLFQNRIDIEELIKCLLGDECFNRESPEVSFLIPRSENFLNILFSRLPFESFERLHVTQLLFLIKRPETCGCQEVYNLALLSDVLPLVLRKSAGYDVYYSYMDTAPMKDAPTGFPYYILFSRYVLLLSPDLGSAWLEDSPQLVDYFRNLFDTAIRESRRLITPFRGSSDFLTHNLESNRNAWFNYSLEYQPCLLSFFTPELLDACAVSGLPHRDRLLALTWDRIRQFHDHGKNIILFNGSSLDEFVKDGVIASVPQGFARPCTVRERLYLLTQLEQCCREERHTIRAFNLLRFHPGRQLYVSLQKNKEVSLFTYDCKLRQYCVTGITESTVYDAFCDFIRYITDEHCDYLCSGSETLELIRKHKKMLLEKGTAESPQNPPLSRQQQEQKKTFTPPHHRKLRVGNAGDWQAERRLESPRLSPPSNLRLDGRSESVVRQPFRLRHHHNSRVLIHASDQLPRILLRHADAA